MNQFIEDKMNQIGLDIQETIRGGNLGRYGQPGRFDDEAEIAWQHERLDVLRGVMLMNDDELREQLSEMLSTVPPHAINNFPQEPRLITEKDFKTLCHVELLQCALATPEGA